MTETKQRGLTNSQRTLLREFERFRKAFGYPPTYQQLAPLLGRCDKASICRSVQVLVKAGYMEGKGRTLRVVRRG